MMTNAGHIKEDSAGLTKYHINSSGFPFAHLIRKCRWVFLFAAEEGVGRLAMQCRQRSGPAQLRAGPHMSVVQSWLESCASDIMHAA
ncbi:MAG TPA: hypothetical protein VF861_14755 [Telluria sp.]